MAVSAGVLALESVQERRWVHPPLLSPGRDVGTDLQHVVEGGGEAHEHPGPTSKGMPQTLLGWCAIHALGAHETAANMRRPRAARWESSSSGGGGRAHA